MSLTRFRDIEQAIYSLIGFIPYLLVLALVIHLDIEVTTPMLVVGLLMLTAHLIGYSLIRRFGQQLKRLEEVTGRVTMSDQRHSIDLGKGSPEELVRIVQHFNTLVAESERSSRSFQDMTAKLMVYTRDIERYQKKLREESVSRNRLSRYVDKSLVEKIINSEEDIPLQNTRQIATVLFADIRSFTSITEHMPPEDVIGMLNDYFDEMVKIIFKYKGVLDKFVGDELMATFGVIGDAREGPLNAVKAAIAMQARVSSLMSEFRVKGYPIFGVGIGINTGEVVIGSVGSRNRMDYTVIGDTVNVAARLQSMAGSSGIVVGEDTFQRCKGSVAMQTKGEIKVKNRAAAVKCYEVSG